MVVYSTFIVYFSLFPTDELRSTGCVVIKDISFSRTQLGNYPRFLCEDKNGSRYLNDLYL
jgi:hypothetical protein